MTKICRKKLEFLLKTLTFQEKSQFFTKRALICEKMGHSHQKIQKIPKSGKRITKNKTEHQKSGELSAFLGAENVRDHCQK